MLTLKTKISTPHYQACALFYQSVFGLEIVESWDEPTDKGIILAVGSNPYQAFLELHHCDAPLEHAAISLQFKVPDLPDFLSALPDEVDADGPHDRPWGARYAFLRDPAGVNVTVFDGPTY